jgi:hypothetical protein
VTHPPSNAGGDVWTMDIVDAKGEPSRIVWNTNWMKSEPYKTNYGMATDLNGEKQPVANGVVTIENRPVRLYGQGSRKAS